MICSPADADADADQTQGRAEHLLVTKAVQSVQGGKAVVDNIEKELGLAPAQNLPCRETFYRYGNTSSSSTW